MNLIIPENINSNGLWPVFLCGYPTVLVQFYIFEYAKQNFLVSAAY